jgi:hypothetical protein
MSRYAANDEIQMNKNGGLVETYGMLPYVSGTMCSWNIAGKPALQSSTITLFIQTLYACKVSVVTVRNYEVGKFTTNWVIWTNMITSVRVK